jgi:hypothetical protein
MILLPNTQPRDSIYWLQRLATVIRPYYELASHGIYEFDKTGDGKRPTAMIRLYYELVSYDIYK